MTSSQAAERQAAHDNLSQELLRELRFAHSIILTALSLMTSDQKNDWARLNAEKGIPGEGTTRYHERIAVITRAQEQA